MIVLAIIGILASVAVPQFFKFSQRARFAELIQLVGKYKAPAEIAFQVAEVPIAQLTSGSFGIPVRLNSADSSLTNLDYAEITAGKIFIKANSALKDATFVFQASNPPNTRGLNWTLVDSESTCLDYGYCSPPQ